MIRTDHLIFERRVAISTKKFPQSFCRRNQISCLVKKKKNSQHSVALENKICQTPFFLKHKIPGQFLTAFVRILRVTLIEMTEKRCETESKDSKCRYCYIFAFVYLMEWKYNGCDSRTTQVKSGRTHHRKSA